MVAALAAVTRWFAAMGGSSVALVVCPWKFRDERAQCLPFAVSGALPAAAAADLVAAAERAAAFRGGEGGGWRSSRAAYLETADVPLSVAVAHGANATAIEALLRTIERRLGERCGASAPRVLEAYVVKYDARGGVRGTGQHSDHPGRYAATVSLNAPRGGGGGGSFRRPEDAERYAARRPPGWTKKDAFAAGIAAGHKAWEPLFDYEDLCAPTCAGQTCDDLLDAHSLAELTRWGCDCALCVKAAPALTPRSLPNPPPPSKVAINGAEDKTDPDSFVGGGTCFAALRDAVFVGDVGDAVLYGTLIRHGADPVVDGRRFILNLLLDDGRCADADRDWEVFILSLGVMVVVAILVAVLCTDFTEDHAANAKKAKKTKAT